MAHDIILNDGDDVTEAAIRTLLGREFISGYIEPGGVGVDYYSSDDTADVESGTVHILSNLQDTTIETDAWVAEPLVTDAVNHLWIAVDPTAATDDAAVSLISNATGVAPSNPNIKIGTVDTTQTGADAVDLLNRGTAPALDGADINPRSIGGTDRLLSIDALQLSEREYYPETFADLQSTVDTAASNGGGTVHAPARVGTTDATIEVPPGVELHLPAGCVIEPTGIFDIVQLRGVGGVSTESIGRLTGPGMLRTRPDKLTQSSITGFDGAAHVLVDGADDIRPTRDDPRMAAEKAVDGVKIMGDAAATGGYGIHLKCDTETSYIWYQAFEPYVYGCEHAIRPEATGPVSASVNGNRFDGTFAKPLRVINDVLGTEDANAISGNELLGRGQSSEAMDQMYHIEGQNWQRHGYDFDIDRPPVYAHFAGTANGNFFGAGASGASSLEKSEFLGVRNTVVEPASSYYNSSVWVSLQSDTPIAASSGDVTVQFDGVHRDEQSEYDGDIHRYRAETPGAVVVNASVQIKSVPAQTNVILAVALNGNNQLSEVHQVQAQKTESLAISTTVDVAQGDEIDIRINPAEDLTMTAGRNNTQMTVEKVR